MTRSIWILSLLASLFLFHLNIPRGAIVPLLISMYLIFTDWHIQTRKSWRDFSKYHILFGLWCTIMIGVSLLLHVFAVPMLIILCTLIGFHMLVIWITLIGGYTDEYIMFHIWYYFVMCILLRYIPMIYWRQNGTIAWLLFPVISFLLYAGWSFFINPFVQLSLQWHYRTAMFFIISFLSSIILYFFSIPLIWWTAALILYACIIWFIVYQYTSFVQHEKHKKIYAEDILAGKRVIQPAEWMRHSAQSLLYRVISQLSYQWRIIIVRCSSLFLIGAIVSAFFPISIIPTSIVFLLLSLWVIVYYYSLHGWSTINYPTVWPDSLVGAWIHAVFIWTLRSYTWDSLITWVFLTMAWSILHHWLSIFLAGQAKYRDNKRKYPLLYGHNISTSLLCIWVMILLSQLWLDSLFVWAVNLIYLGIVGTMVYFFSRAWQK